MPKLVRRKSELLDLRAVPVRARALPFRSGKRPTSFGDDCVMTIRQSEDSFMDRCVRGCFYNLVVGRKRYSHERSNENVGA